MSRVTSPRVRLAATGLILSALAGCTAEAPAPQVEMINVPDIRGLPLEIADLTFREKGFPMIVKRASSDCPLPPGRNRPRPPHGCDFPLGIDAQDFVVDHVMGWEEGLKQRPGIGFLVYAKASGDTPRNNFVLSTLGQEGEPLIRVTSGGRGLCFRREQRGSRARQECVDSDSRSMPLATFEGTEADPASTATWTILPKGWRVEYYFDQVGEWQSDNTSVVLPPVGFKPRVRLYSFGVFGGASDEFRFRVFDERDRIVHRFVKTGQGPVQRL